MGSSRVTSEIRASLLLHLKAAIGSELSAAISRSRSRVRVTVNTETRSEMLPRISPPQRSMFVILCNKFIIKTSMASKSHLLPECLTSELFSSWMDRKHELQHVVDHSRIRTGICMYSTHMCVYIRTHTKLCFGSRNLEKIVGFGFIDIPLKTSTSAQQPSPHVWLKSLTRAVYSGATRTRPSAEMGSLVLIGQIKTHDLVTLTLH